MSKRDFITVEELNYFINNIFLNEELLHNVPVVGEVSGVSVVSGNCYFTLKDQKAQIRVVFFNCYGRYTPHNGEKVLVRGSVDYYIKGGTLNIKAYEVIHFGAGLLYMQFEELKKRLDEEGLFSEKHKKDIPTDPKRVAVITSIKGAAVQDFITTVRKYNSVIDITVIDVRVQGEGCVSDVVTALNNADDYGFDIIVLARGGGSFEDLFCFNDESIVRKIYEMHTPVISAIGHETDYTLCDFVADYRAITPTAAAEKVSFSERDVRERLLSYARNIRDKMQNLLRNAVEKICDYCAEIEHSSNLIIEKNTIIFKNYLEKMKILQTNSLSFKNSKLIEISRILERLNPLQLLNAGYFRILLGENYIYKTSEVKENDEISILGIDGTIEAKVISVKGGSNEVRK